MSSNMGSEGREQRAEAARLDAAIEANLKELGYDGCACAAGLSGPSVGKQRSGT